MTNLIYTKSTLNLPDDAEISQIIQHVSQMKDRIVVNIGAPNEPGVLFTSENLHAMLDSGVRELVLESIGENDYCKLLNQQLRDLLSATDQLRIQLRDTYIQELLACFSQYLTKMNHCILLCKCYMIQKRNETKLVNQVAGLGESFEKLSEAGFYLEDSVACLDLLRYEIIPCIERTIRSVKFK